MITYNGNKNFALAVTAPANLGRQALCVWLPATGEQLWRLEPDREGTDGEWITDVAAGTFAGSGELQALWQDLPERAAEAEVWDRANDWNGWTATTPVARGEILRVGLTGQPNGTYRGDLQYATKANGQTLTLEPGTPVVAMKCRMPDAAVATWDIVDAAGVSLDTHACSGRAMLPDGWTLLWVDCSEWMAEMPFREFQIKVADVPAVVAESMRGPGYSVAWIGAFCSVDSAAGYRMPVGGERIAFADGGRVWVGTGGHWRRRHAEDFKAAAEAARRELEAAAVELDMARDELDKTRGELDTARAEIAGKDAEIAELSTREPADYWLDAMERGRHVAQWLTANFKDCGYWGFTSCGWSKASQIEAALGLDKPWVMPPMTLPSSPEGKAGTLGATFVKCGNMLYCYPIKIEEGCTLEQTFHSCVRLTRAPEIDTSKVRNFSGCFYGCGRITDWPDWDFSEAVNMGGFFQAPMLEVDGPPAGGVVETREVWLPNATTLRWAFNEHRNLRRLGRIHAPKCSNLRLFNTPNVLERIDGLDLDAQTENAFASGYQRPLCKYIMLYNLGKCSTPGQQYLYYYPNWGKDSDENRQSLVDSLLTNSYDRVAAGLEEPYEIILDPATTARLTAEEIAAITAKGFTITSQKY